MTVLRTTWDGTCDSSMYPENNLSVPFSSPYFKCMLFSWSLSLLVPPSEMWIIYALFSLPLNNHATGSIINWKKKHLNLTRKQPRSPPTGEWINEVWCVLFHCIEYSHECEGTTAMCNNTSSKCDVELKKIPQDHIQQWYHFIKLKT